MGLWAGIKDTYRKSEAAILVQNLLERQVDAWTFTLDPAAVATMLVKKAWARKPEICSGKIGQGPHKICVAAMALAEGITSFGADSAETVGLVLALGNLLNELETNGARYPLTAMDKKLIAQAAEAWTPVVRYSGLPPTSSPLRPVKESCKPLATVRALHP